MSEMQTESAVLVGGTSGVGLKVAQLFAAAGVKVVLGGRSEDKLKEAIERIGGAATGFSLDVRQEEQVHEFFERAGGFDHLVITASAAFMDRPLVETTISELREFAETKLWGTLQCVKSSLDTLAEGGSITLVSGAVARKGRSGAHAKTITNSALEALTRSLAVEFGPRARVNCVSPGIFDSKGIMPPEKKDKIGGMYPLKYVGSAGDVASLIVAVARNAFMTGSVIYADGGWTAT